MPPPPYEWDETSIAAETRQKHGMGFFIRRRKERETKKREKRKKKEEERRRSLESVGVGGVVFSWPAEAIGNRNSLWSYQKPPTMYSSNFLSFAEMLIQHSVSLSPSAKFLHFP